MRLALVLICMAVVVYAAWQFLSPVERRHAVRHIRHGMRIGAIVLAILLLLAAMVYFLPPPPTI